MTDKEAIEYLKTRLSVLHRNYQFATEQAIEIVLNLIQKQQKEIEELRNNNKDLLRKLRNRVKEVKKLTKYSLYKNEFSTLNKQLKKKDKIIDSMVTAIVNYDDQLVINRYRDKEHVKETFEEYFERECEG